MKLILNWSKQQWLGMDAYQKSDLPPKSWTG